MEGYHFSKGECEQCGHKLNGENDTLQPINFWYVKPDSRRIPYYLYVCDTCFDTRKSWCNDLYPDQCELCSQPIEDADHYLEKEVLYAGLAPNEECKVICHDCHTSKKKIQA